MDFQEDKLDPNMDFYILGLSPNAARLSVRFFLHNTLRGFLAQLCGHAAEIRGAIRRLRLHGRP